MLSRNVRCLTIGLHIFFTMSRCWPNVRNNALKKTTVKCLATCKKEYSQRHLGALSVKNGSSMLTYNQLCKYNCNNYIWTAVKIIVTGKIHSEGGQITQDQIFILWRQEEKQRKLWSVRRTPNIRNLVFHWLGVIMHWRTHAFMILNNPEFGNDWYCDYFCAFMIWTNTKKEVTYLVNMCSYFFWHLLSFRVLGCDAKHEK